MTAIDTVRRLVGRRHKITAEEMIEILLALDLDPALSTITGRGQDGALYVGDRWVADPADEQAAVARAWARMCDGICCISVVRMDDSLGVRYDSPGSMHPGQQAEILFAPAELTGYEYDQIGQLRRHARRVLVVSPLPPEPEPPRKVPAWIAALRRREWCDGTWTRVHDDGMLELRDPNSGQSSNPADKPRHQYRLADGYFVSRCLPPESVGDAWEDIGEPEWEYRDPPRSGPIADWLDAQL